MRRFTVSSNFSCAVLLAMSMATAISQQQPEKKPPLPTASSRLISAKTVVMTRARGSNIPYDVVSSTLEGWGRFTLVETRDKADLIVEVSTSGGDSDVKFSSSEGPSSKTGEMERSTRSTKDLSSSEVTLTVYDASNKRVLWTARETAKFAMKQTARENNLVEAAQHLVSKFHDRIEPPPPPDQK